MLELTLENFEAEALAASMHTPVLVDFWAPWCSPCRAFAPLLDKVEAAYAGRFVLAKVNTEDQPQLAAMFGIRSIPTCVLLIGGQPVDGFQGALPERDLRAFLDKHLPPAQDMPQEDDAPPDAAAQARQLLAAGDRDSALQGLRAALEANPEDDGVRCDCVRLLIETGALQEAEDLLAGPRKRISHDSRFDALHQWLLCARFVREEGPGDCAGLDARIAQNPRDLAARFARARVLAAQSRWSESMEELLQIILRDKAWEEQAARKLYVAILELITPPRPKEAAPAKDKSATVELLPGQQRAADEATQLLERYRRKLSMALN